MLHLTQLESMMALLEKQANSSANAWAHSYRSTLVDLVARMPDTVLKKAGFMSSAELVPDETRIAQKKIDLVLVSQCNNDNLMQAYLYMTKVIFFETCDKDTALVKTLKYLRDLHGAFIVSGQPAPVVPQGNQNAKEEVEQILPAPPARVYVASDEDSAFGKQLITCKFEEYKNEPIPTNSILVVLVKIITRFDLDVFLEQNVKWPTFVSHSNGNCAIIVLASKNAIIGETKEIVTQLQTRVAEEPAVVIAEWQIKIDKNQKPFCSLVNVGEAKKSIEHITNVLVQKLSDK